MSKTKSTTGETIKSAKKPSAKEAKLELEKKLELERAAAEPIAKKIAERLDAICRNTRLLDAMCKNKYHTMAHGYAAVERPLRSDRIVVRVEISDGNFGRYAASLSLSQATKYLELLERGCVFSAAYFRDSLNGATFAELNNPTFSALDTFCPEKDEQTIAIWKDYISSVAREMSAAKAHFDKLSSTVPAFLADELNAAIASARDAEAKSVAERCAALVLDIDVDALGNITPAQLLCLVAQKIRKDIGGVEET